MPIDTNRLAGSPLAKHPLFAELVKKSGAPGRQSGKITREQLEAAEEEQRLNLMVSYLKVQAAMGLGMNPEDLNPDTPLNELGLDSLMVMELRHLLIADLQIDIPAIEFFNSPKVSELAVMALKRMAVDPTETAIVPVESQRAATSVDVDNLSDAKVEAMLAQMNMSGSEFQS